MSKKEHRQGGKFSGSHTTTTSAALEILDALAKSELVTKIILGILISDAGKAGRPLHVTAVQQGPTCIRVVIAKGGTIQTVYIYTDSPANVQTVIELSTSFTDAKSGKRGKAARTKRSQSHPTPKDFNT